MSEKQLVAAVDTREKVHKELPFTVEERAQTDGKICLVVDSDQYGIVLFPANSEFGDKGSRIKYNANVTLKGQDISFRMVVKELKADGTLIAGQQGSVASRRAVVTEWDKNTMKSYNRMEIGRAAFDSIMGIISAVDAAK